MNWNASGEDVWLLCVLTIMIIVLWIMSIDKSRKG